MSKIETMRNSGSTAAQLKSMQSVIDLQETLKHLNPAEIEQAIAQVQQTAAVYGDLIARGLIEPTQALLVVTQQAQDVTNHLRTTVGAAQDYLGKVAIVLREATAALKLIQEPSTVKKTSLEVLLSMAPTASFLISLLTLAVVLIRG